MLRLSVIIPMYNVAPYVEKCIRSLENQDIPHSEYEVICVNDGSPDNCKEIVGSLQNEFSNITLIDQKNQGVSMARNNAIDIAKGEYILFIDPDDYVDENSFKRILTKAEKFVTDVSFLGYTFLNSDGTVKKFVFNEENSKDIYTGIEAYSLARGDGMTDPDRLWAVLIRRDLLDRNGLRFLADVPYLEDGELIARIMCVAELCIFDGNSFYQRTTRKGSATNSKLLYSKKAINGFVKSSLNLKRFQQNTIISEEQKTFLNQPICKFTLLAFTGCLTFRRLFYITDVKKQLNQGGIKQLDLDGIHPFYYKNGILYNQSIILFLFVWMLPNSFFSRIKNHIFQWSQTRK
ncbi:MAG: glycosyltransferase [Bacteroidales bacterium]|nr:glycosyltransferase [Bacteroidales bacterium]